MIRYHAGLLKNHTKIDLWGNIFTTGNWTNIPFNCFLFHQLTMLSCMNLYIYFMFI